jgi:hypothetical protein
MYLFAFLNFSTCRPMSPPSANLRGGRGRGHASRRGGAVASALLSGVRTHSMTMYKLSRSQKASQ